MVETVMQPAHILELTLIIFVGFAIYSEFSKRF